jgi:PAS domain S-box-containing protein
MRGLKPVLNQSDDAFQQKKTRLTTRLLFSSTILVFCVETLVMILLESYFKLTLYLDLMIDGLLLMAVLLPVNYFFIVRPLSREIDQHRQTNQDLIRSHNVLERFFSVKDMLIAHLDADFNFIRVNQAYADADQHEPDYYVGKNRFNLFPDAENQSIFETVVRTGKAFTVTDKPFEYAHNPKRGTRYWDWSLLPIKDASGRVIELLFVLMDVTFRKQAQTAIAESERRFKAVFNQTFQHMALLDPDGNILLVNQMALKFSGYSEEDVAGKPFWQLPCWCESRDQPGDPSEALRSAIAQVASCEVIHREQQIISASGEQAILDITLKPLLDDQGRASFIIYEARDITERIRAEKALLRSQLEIQRLYQTALRERERADSLRGLVQALSVSLDSRSVLDILLDNLYKVVLFSSAHIFLLEDDDYLVVRIARGEERWDAPARLADRRFDISEYPFLQTVLAGREVFSVKDDSPAMDNIFFQAAPSVASWLAIPLRAGDQVIGLYTLEHDRPAFFTEEMIQWVITLTEQASFAIHNAWLFEQVRDNREQLQILAQRLVEAQENERNFIARELHDDAGQALAAMMFGLRQLELDSGDPAAVIQHSRELKKTADGVMENLHRLAANLRPSTLDHLGLIPALRQYAETLSTQHELAIQFETIGNIERLPGEMETAIYRIVQESLTNIIRHARATRVDILLERLEDQIVAVVEANGIGFDPQAPVSDHLGVLGMRERAGMLGRRLTIESAPGKGSTVLLEVPCPSAS